MENLQTKIGQDLQPVILDLAIALKTEVIPVLEQTVGLLGTELPNGASLLGQTLVMLANGGVPDFNATLSDMQQKLNDARVAALMAKEVGIAPLLDSFDRAPGILQPATVAIVKVDDAADDLKKSLEDTKKAADDLWTSLIERTKLPDWTLDEKRRLKDLPLLIRIAKDDVALARRTWPRRAPRQRSAPRSCGLSMPSATKRTSSRS